MKPATSHLGSLSQTTYGSSGEAIEVELEFSAIETRVGTFKADILAKEVGTGDYIIIENQLERTDHDHLGKLLTYAAGVGAKAVVWVAAELCEEHRKALDWLNDITQEGVNFSGVQVELWRIRGSEPAPRFNVICQPNEWAKALTDGRPGELTETRALQLAYWTALIQASRAALVPPCNRPRWLLPVADGTCP
jgi:hypothetical protein